MGGNVMQLLLMILAIFIGCSECKFGESCISDQTCEESFGLSAQQCLDGVCQCRRGVEIRYTRYMEPHCSSGSSFSLNFMSGGCHATSCRENFECVEPTDSSDSSSLLMLSGKTHCRCKQGYLRANNDCREASQQEVLQNCNVPKSGPVNSCDINEHSYCKSGKCICFDTHFANTTSGKCELKENYIRAFNLTSYRVKPEEYCTKTSHCILGLVCRKFRCCCPSQRCSCGVAEVPILSMFMCIVSCHSRRQSVAHLMKRSPFVMGAQKTPTYTPLSYSAQTELRVSSK